MKKTLIAIPLLLATQTVFAEGYYVAVGYDPDLGSGDASLGYQAGNMAVEANIHTMGKEEATTRPGPEIILNALAFVPSLPLPVFLKAGIVAGMGGKKGITLGVGADYALNESWALRAQETHYRVTEEIMGGIESENIFTVGLKYQF